ncbi:MAG: MBL fold metallo-hydrolase [Prochlorococcus marinus CUG1438]|nr:MBL fold metallo-hydrolase [Prochlorococcus marinus CUG1438]
MISQIKNIFFFILFSSFLPTQLFARNLLIKSLGHSSFLINSKEQSILINPFKAIGCASNLKEPKEVNVDFILASSRLSDEGYNPNNQLMFVDPGIYQYEDILLNGISVPHDRVNGRRFGMATVWSWEQNDLKIVHMGGAAGEIDINGQIILSRPDILFISIGGGVKSYDGLEASRIVKLLKPNVVIPVNFARGKKINKECDFSNADLFIENMKDFKVKYVGKYFRIKSKRIDQNTIYIFGN